MGKAVVPSPLAIIMRQEKNGILGFVLKRVPLESCTGPDTNTSEGFSTFSWNIEKGAKVSWPDHFQNWHKSYSDFFISPAKVGKYNGLTLLLDAETYDYMYQASWTSSKTIALTPIYWTSSLHLMSIHLLLNFLFSWRNRFLKMYLFVELYFLKFFTLLTLSFVCILSFGTLINYIFV